MPDRHEGETTIRLGWDIVEFIGTGDVARATETLAAQRRIALPDARATIQAWMDEHATEAMPKVVHNLSLGLTADGRVRSAFDS